MKDYKYVIVGGGIAGLLSAILLKRQYKDDNIVLIESEPECGGLLRSIKTDPGYEFDYGTHVIGETGITDLDDIVCPKNQAQWSSLPKLKPGNIVNGHFHKMSQLLYAKALPKEVLAQATYELLASPPKNSDDAKNLEEYCHLTYGETFTEQLFVPLMKKLTHTDINQLHPDALALFGFNRLIIGDQFMMKELKQIARLDSILGFETYNEGVSSLKCFYPKHGKGIGLWIEEMVEQASELGVEILVDTQVTGFDKPASKVISLSTNNPNYPTINLAELVWTTPLFPLIKLAELPFESHYRPKINQVVLHHFAFDKAFETNNFHVYLNQPDLVGFRVTLYSNISEENAVNGAHRCTVEVLIDQDINIDNNTLERMRGQILDELVATGIVNQHALPLYQASQLTKNGFPVYTNNFVKELARQRYCVEEIDNIHILGKASAKHFFMTDVLKEIYNHFTSI